MNADQRLTTLEEKILFQEDTIQKLDAVIAKQYKLIDALARRVSTLENKTQLIEEEMQSQPATITDEKPPHY
jgi:SlyX protein